MKKRFYIILFSGLTLLLCLPLYSYVGEEKAPEDALEILTLPDAQERIDLEREKLEEGRKQSKEVRDILKNTEDKDKKEIFLAPQAKPDWPSR